MAHNLATRADGTASMMYVGQTPWHGLGKSLDNPATSAEAIVAAGLDWTVRLDDLVTSSGLTVPMARAVVRDDTNAVFGTVGRNWQPIQNADAFAFLDGMVASGDVTYHTAGALGRGEKVWMLAKLPGHVRITGTDDITEKYLLLSTGHDGKSACRCFFTPIRVVCQNTLNMATRTGERQGVTIRHTGHIEFKLHEARRILGLAEQFYADMAEQANYLASRKMGRDGAMAYFSVVVPAAENEEASKTVQETRHSLMNLWENGKGQDMPGVRHSYWAAYNAVTEFIDHSKPVAATARLSLESARMNRLNSIWFGAGADLKSTAYTAAMAMATRN